MAKIRIMLADDHTLFRQGIRTLISAEADMEVVGEAPNGGDAVEGTVVYVACNSGLEAIQTNPLGVAWQTSSGASGPLSDRVELTAA